MRKPTKTNAYVLDEQAQAHLKDGINSLWQAHTVIETIQKAYEDDEHITLISALNSVLALINNCLNDLAEV